jgi:uncharacterized protein YeeX (DUF496 family)
MKPTAETSQGFRAQWLSSTQSHALESVSIRVYPWFRKRNDLEQKTERSELRLLILNHLQKAKRNGRSVFPMLNRVFCIHLASTYASRITDYALRPANLKIMQPYLKISAVF